jgi:hypothetical protein
MKFKILLLLALLAGAVVLAPTYAKIEITDGTNTSHSDPGDEPQADPTDPADLPHADATDPADLPHADRTDPADLPHPDDYFGDPFARPAEPETAPPPDTQAAPKRHSDGSAEVMTAEMGEEIARKLEEFERAQKKVFEKFDEIEKDYAFIKAAMGR